MLQIRLQASSFTFFAFYIVKENKMNENVPRISCKVPMSTNIIISYSCNQIKHFCHFSCHASGQFWNICFSLRYLSLKFVSFSERCLSNPSKFSPAAKYMTRESDGLLTISKHELHITLTIKTHFIASMLLLVSVELMRG